MCSFLNGHGSFARKVKYLTAIVNGRFIMVIVRWSDRTLSVLNIEPRRWSYLASQWSYTFCVPRFRSVKCPFGFLRIVLSCLEYYLNIASFFWRSTNWFHLIIWKIRVTRSHIQIAIKFFQFHINISYIYILYLTVHN